MSTNIDEKSLNETLETTINEIMSDITFEGDGVFVDKGSPRVDVGSAMRLCCRQKTLSPCFAVITITLYICTVS